MFRANPKEPFVPQRATVMPAIPSGRYERDGEFYLDFPEAFPDDQYFHAFQRVIRANTPPGALDYEDVFSPSTLWVKFGYAQRVEAIARLFWPGMLVVSWQNPRYNPEFNVVRQLAAARRAVTAAEAAVRCGLAVAR